MQSSEAVAAERAAIMQRLQQIDQAGAMSQVQPQQQVDIWKELDGVNAELTDADIEALGNDEEYLAASRQLDAMMQQALASLARPIIAKSKEGQDFVKEFTALTKAKRSSISAQKSKELEQFEAFKAYSAKHPNATFEEFVKTQQKKK